MGSVSLAKESMRRWCGRAGSEPAKNSHRRRRTTPVENRLFYHAGFTSSGATKRAPALSVRLPHRRETIMPTPQSPVRLLIEAQWIAPVRATDASAHECLVDHAVAVDDERIVEVLPVAQARQR